MEQEQVIKIKNVGIKYGDNWVIRNFNTDFYQGQMVALIGSNGAGKTTLMNTIAGAIHPEEGKVEFNKKLLNKHAFSSIGWSPQRQVIDWYLNVYNNVYMGAMLAGYSKRESKIKTNNALKIVGLEDMSKKHPDALSGGQQQRVQIARAIVHTPKIMILDEPTTGLDAESTDNLLASLKKHADMGNFVLLSSHDLHSVENYCDTIMFIDKGKLIYFEKKEAFLSRFQNFEVLTLEIEHELSDAQFNTLQKSIEIISRNPLQVRIKSNEPLGDLIQLVERYVCVKDVKKEKSNLRDIYLKLKEGE
ncbi:metal ABC transporter ATP-binding protein [Planococcus lenghuensis]|uniref:ABC transporter domain-containing protein n=1 Tax=Planococcus lenghuensis TaxID=2213202 RepID=A0A1Q2L4M8_9BACL|nr:ABC transporter ATP-binding protein [Planococcus lenghuensis]AQQ55415.1 hypothetical protein B0X71_19810 [Planococcus lenghuensis]